MNQLTMFFYLLLRDSLIVGEVEKLVKQVEKVETAEFSNPHLRNYSMQLASRVLNMSSQLTPEVLREGVARIKQLATGVKFPHPCECCGKQIESQDDYEWHGFGNCVNLCPTCLGSGEEPENYKKQFDEQTQAFEKAKWSAQLFVLEKLAKVYCRSCLTGELRIQRPDLGSLYFHDKTRCNASEIWESYDAIKERGSAL